jgi:hypothetical protein
VATVPAPEASAASTRSDHIAQRSHRLGEDAGAKITPSCQEAPNMKFKHQSPRLGTPTRVTCRALLLAGGLLATLSLTGCGLPIRVGGPDSTHALVVPDEHYAVYEVEITEPGVYALSVIDLDPKVSNKLVDRLRSLNRIADVLESSIRLPGESSQIGTDTFDDLAGVIWALYGRSKDTAAVAVATAPSTAITAAPTATPLAAPPTKLDPGTLGPRLMQSTERPLAERGQRAPERARLEPGRYVIRVATGYGTQRTATDRVDVGLVRLPDLLNATATTAATASRVPAVPFGSAAPTPGVSVNPVPAPAQR